MSGEEHRSLDWPDVAALATIGFFLLGFVALIVGAIR